ncbi:MAG: rRNA pseudouridine synthase [Gemmataceae bacterium]|nr:rRNA pseudouridine synthase [Gemmataceae bacterium]
MERLNKYLAHAGIGSRRHCDGLIAAGRVKVDGVPVSDLGLKINPEAHKVSVDDHPVKSEKPVYWAVNKPVGVLCTNDDPDGRPRAIDLLPHVEQRVYTVGRLDEDSEGLLLMTNDGELAFHLTHPRYGIPKTYQVLVAGKPTPPDLQKLLDGVWISDGKVKAREVRRLKPQGDSTWLRVVLTEGKNREVRRMLAGLGHKVMRLKRVAIGPVRLDRLPKGKARRVSEPELAELRKWVTNAQARLVKAKQRAADQQAGGGPKASGGRKPPVGGRAGKTFAPHPTGFKPPRADFPRPSGKAHVPPHRPGDRARPARGPHAPRPPRSR